MRMVPKFVLSAIALVALATVAPAQSDDHTSHTPPVGPPWIRDFAQARTQALQLDKPIFVYSTKTY